MSTPPPALRTVADLLAAVPPALRAEARDCDPTHPLGLPRSDSRLVGPGDCFVALRGGVHDSHDFLDQARAAGAGLLIVQRGHPRAGDAAGHPRVLVEDSAALLPTLAAGWHGWPGQQLRLAGVTGTNGKTTTAHLLAGIFAAAGRPHLRLGTTGNWLVDHEAQAQFTTPFPAELQALLAEARDRGATHGVMEVSSHALDQGRARPLRFDAVALTSFSQDHLDYHPSMAAYLEAKCRLAREHCLGAGVAVSPREQGEAAEAFLRAAAEAGVARRWRSARAPTPSSEAEIAVVEALPPSPGIGLGFRVRTPAGELELRSPMVGTFNLDNLLVAVGLALGLDLDLGSIAAGLARTGGAPGRLELVQAPERGPGRRPQVYVDYAHTPDAVDRSLAALRPLTAARGGRLIVVLGCGGDRDPGKRPAMGAAAAAGADRFYATSDNPRTEDPDAIVDQMLAGVTAGATELVRVVDRAAAITQAIAEADPADTVLLAGKGHEDYQILGTETIHFDDREHARAALVRRARLPAT